MTDNVIVLALVRSERSVAFSADSGAIVALGHLFEDLGSRDLAVAEVSTGSDLRLYGATVDRASSESVRDAIQNVSGVDTAWVEEVATIPFIWVARMLDNPCLAGPVRKEEEAPSKTPDFSSRQIYLSDAPVGIGALSAHAVAGGKGEGIRVIDVEGGWRYQHEDAPEGWLGIIFGTNSTDELYLEHGTSMVSILSSRANGIGVVGIAPAAEVGGVSGGQWSTTTHKSRNPRSCRAATRGRYLAA